MKDRIHEILKKYWGFSTFRPLQQEIITSVLSGRDTLALMPTGGGKSLTFQIPGLFYETGITLVISPLISLMKDQVDNLKRQKIKAVFLHSGMRPAERSNVWDKIINGGARFLYISPERLKNERFINDLRNIDINLIVVDEAHCISQWGYDFRPDYLEIKKIRKVKPGTPILALTATATPEVTKDIMKNLLFKEELLLKKSFQRENINYIVRETPDKIKELVHILSNTSGSTIIYVRSRKRTREISQYLEGQGFTTTFYHAGLDFKTKEDNQNIWKTGISRIIVATNAFGMGIDKADVRLVVHFGLPPSPEEYYQETGRAGRDGKNSYAVLLINNQDSSILRRHLTQTFPPRKDIKDIYEKICIFLNYSIGEGYDRVKEFDIKKFCNLRNINEKTCRSSLKLLGQAGYMFFLEDPDMRSRVKIELKREELYDLKNVSDNAEKVLNILLRLYPGLFAEYKYIYETEISMFGKLSQEDVYQALLELSRKKIISFIPRSGLPLIHMSTSREDKSNILIGKNIYEERMEIMKHRIETMINYAFNKDDCRVSSLLEYLGEKSCDCGKCDICRNKKKKKEKPINIFKSISDLLKDYPEGLSIQMIEKLLSVKNENIMEPLNILVNEGIINTENQLYFIN